MSRRPTTACGAGDEAECSFASTVRGEPSPAGRAKFRDIAPRYFAAAVCRRGHPIDTEIDLYGGARVTVTDDPGPATLTSLGTVRGAARRS
jgi:hypothetical protein